MKIIFKDYAIELSYDEFKKLFPLKTVKPIKIEKRGKYKHKSKLTNKEKALIKKITTQYPDRKDTSIAEELNKYTNSDKFTREVVRYWREHG